MTKTIAERFKDVPVPFLEYFAGWKPGDGRPEGIKNHPFIGMCALPAPERGATFAGEADVGWCDSGFAAFARVVDPYAANCHKDDELWKGSSVEIFISSGGERNFTVANVLQVVAAMPDENDFCRFYCYGGDTAPAFRSVKCSGKRTPDGFEITIFVPWEALGEGSREIVMTDGCRMNMAFNNSDGGVLTLNGKCFLQPRKSASDLFVLLKDTPDDREYDISSRYTYPVGNLAVSCGEHFVWEAGRPCRAKIEDMQGAVLAEYTFPDGKVDFPAPDERFARMKIYSLDGKGNFLITSKYLMTIDFHRLSALMASPENPRQRVLAAGLINAVESFRTGENTEFYIQEIVYRQKQLDGEDISSAPGVLRYLNLMNDPSGLVQTGIPRLSTSNQCAPPPNQWLCVTVQWGGVPVLYCDIYCYDSEEKARADIRSRKLMRNPLPAPQIGGADEVFAGRGYHLGDALVGDYDPEHLMGIVHRDSPDIFGRGEPEQVMRFSPAAFIVNDGANPEHIAMLQEAGVPQISQEEAAGIDGHVVVLGEERWGGFFFQPMNGVEDDRCWVRKGDTVFRASYNVPEIAVQVLEALIACRPITFAEVDHWRKLKLDSLGGDLPEYREQGRLVRTGEVHCHSNYSDASASPGTLLMEAAACGMEFLVITDHNTNTGAVLLAAAMKEAGINYPFIVGEEITMNLAYHMNLFPLPEKICQNNKSYDEIIAEARAQGAIVMLNHPMTYGMNLRKHWYSLPEKWGIDVIEHNISQRERWQKAGYDPAFMGSTDAHCGIFGHCERAAFLAEEVNTGNIAGEVLAKRCAMLAPDLPEHVYGNEVLCKAVRAALGDDSLPELHEKRLNKAFAGCDIGKFCRIAPDGSDSDLFWGWMGDPDEDVSPVPDRV